MKYAIIQPLSNEPNIFSIKSFLIIIISFRLALYSTSWSEILFLNLLQLRQAKDDIVTASKVAYRFLAGVTLKSSATSENASNSNNGCSRFQGAWLRNLVSPGAKPSSSTHPEDSSLSPSPSSSDDELSLEHKKLTERVQSDPGRST